MSNASSDYNNGGSSNISLTSLYADLDIGLPLHPVRKDIRPTLDIQAVRNSVRNLVLTNFGDRPFQPKLGSNITALLFEPADQFTGIQMKKEIERLLKDHEPRVNSVKIQILDDSDANAYRITIGFNVIAYNTNTNISFALQRLR